MIDLSYERNSQSEQTVEDPPVDKWADELNQRPQHSGLFEGYKAIAVMALGVILPSIFLVIFAVACHERISMLLIKHPLETLVEAFLALCIPLGNLSVWTAVCRKDTRFAMRRGFQNGFAIGGSLLFIAVSLAAICTGRASIYVGSQLYSFTEGFVAIALVFLASLGVGIYLTNELRQAREFKSARIRTVVYSMIGVVFALLGFVGSEAKSMYMRIAEHMAFASATIEEQVQGLKMLRGLNAEQDMRLECADPRTAGLAGLFIPINNSTQQQLYFAAFGKPFRDDRSADLSGFSNDYLHRHVVGSMIPELSLVRSGMDGAVNPDSLSSTINWTFVFKNTAYEDKEARAELSLPPGAVVSNVTVWEDGQAINASFAASGRAPTAGGWTNIGHTTPAVVSDLGRGRTLLHCFPVKAQAELKVRLTMIMPLKLDLASEATLALPRFIDTNFSVNGEHQIRLRSPERLSLKLDGLKETLSPTKEKILSGRLKDEELSGLGLSVTAERKPTFTPIAVFDPRQPSKVIVQTIKQMPVKLPNHLIVVLDGSQNVKADLADIKEGLASLPSSVTSSLMVATDVSPKLQELQPLAAGLPKLSQSDFDGGQDNLMAVVKAASTAGETKNGAVLWIHGPQPTLNGELYVVAPYTQTPSFYELSLDNGVTDGNEFFKNHREIGPFAPVPRNGSIKHDLKRFLSKWQPGGIEYVVKLDQQTSTAKLPMGTAQQAIELSSLAAKERSQALLARGDSRMATEVAVNHGLVTPVSSAVVLGAQNAYQSQVARNYWQGTSVGLQARQDGTTDEANNAEREALAPSNSADPALTGATNGSIGPQGTDATYVTGINTAGTVRVNNLANLETMLNLMANGFELCAILSGLFLIGLAFVNKSAAQQWFGLKGVPVPLMISLGCAIIVVGLAAPGVLNWFVASARDANLFS
jgi:hypothetical protein